MEKQILQIGILLSMTSVILGAFGAHSLEPILIENDRIDTFETAVRYQFFHSLAIIIAGLIFGKYQNKKSKIAAILFLIGIIIFSGSLYILSITNITWLGAITPIGGLAFIVGWIYLLLSLK